MKLKYCTLEQLEQQKQQLIESSDEEWKETIFYAERMTEIERCIELKKNDDSLTRYYCPQCAGNDISTSRIGDVIGSAFVGKCNECSYNFTISINGDFNGC
ncbi:hypothetical protein BZG01_00100 [Labilibaculum manganireducens]|uniref:Uncharacterized protein n=1 Tax=Labilibaculum manganireducens TaxID=1940525 RepID=A0A2N3IGB7_9BACT|nr:hypothetical protein [Labilibaculum manganireducens]PKQ69374.1 hypothetical protein BZG01_00100 [Labilibaculum manganireducens]